MQLDLFRHRIGVRHRLRAHLIHGNAQRIAIARARVCGAADGAQELWRHVRQRADDELLEEAAGRPGLHDNVGRDLALPFCRIEIGEDGAARAVEKDIVRFHVAVEDVARV